MSIEALGKLSIIREYIVPNSYPDNNLHDFPLLPNIIDENHFILAFATEDYDEYGRGKGTFKRPWNNNDLSPERINNLKHKYVQEVKVKVVLGIGGRGSEYPFNPADKETWPEIAADSLKQVIHDCDTYFGRKLIDGIDINYEKIESGEIDFAVCIGRLIKRLKQEGLANVVSIAPSYNVQPHFKKLYQAYGIDINWVDYQFYDQPISSADEFVKLYNLLSNDYPHQKLLAGYSNDPSDAGKLSQDVFIEGCKYLIQSGLLPGIFLWKAKEPPFMLEPNAHELASLPR